jgi:uncharacterized protein (DUF1919 family)
MIPKTYNPWLTLKNLNDCLESLTLLDCDIDFNISWDSQEIADTLEMVDFPKRQRKNITAVATIIEDGELEAVWVSEDNAPYENRSCFYALPYYRPSNWSKKYLPNYWLENNCYYNDWE